jgi:putative phosphoribosyl transferase
MVKFSSLKEAAFELTSLLPDDKMKSEEWIVIAISISALPIADEIAQKFNLSLDLLFNEPIMSPVNSEYEVAMVSETEEIVMHDALVNAFEIEYDFIYGEAKRNYEEKILSNIYQFKKGEPIQDLENKNILLVDTGSTTGLRFMTSVKTVISKEAHSVYIAAPVMAKEVYESLNEIVDDVFVIETIENYINTASYYKDEIHSIDDQTIYEMLKI